MIPSESSPGPEHISAGGGSTAPRWSDLLRAAEETTCSESVSPDSEQLNPSG